MKSRVCILFNRLDEFEFKSALQFYLPRDRFEVTIADKFPDDPSVYRLIAPWSYRKIIKQAAHARNVVIMHSSELPEGRGWAPIYHAFSEQKSEHVISGILGADDVDAGDIIVRARFPIQGAYTASFIRTVDQELSLLLIAKIIENWPEGSFTGVKQVGQGSYRPRRRSSENEIDLSKTLSELLPHLRGVEPKNPAFFYYQNVKYIISAYPESKPEMPGRVIIEYPALGKVELWNGWHDSP